MKPPLYKLLLIFLISPHSSLSLPETAAPYPPQLRQIISTFQKDSVNTNKLFVENLLPPNLKETFARFSRATLFEGSSTECQGDLGELWSQLIDSVPGQGGDLNVPSTWALQMLDAWGKFPSGILSGHTQIPGDFNECLQIRGNYTKTKINRDLVEETHFNFKGRYCSTYLEPNPEVLNFSMTNYQAKNPFADSNLRESVSPEEFVVNALGGNGIGVNLFPFIGTCFPSSCSKEDVQKIFHNFYNETTGGALVQSVVECFTEDKPPFDAADIAVIALLSTIGFLCLVGSLYDILIYRRKSNTKVSSNVAQLFLAFSVPLNTEKFLSTNVGNDNVTCLHGLRFLSIAWVVLGHTWEMISWQFTWNLIDVQNMYRPFMLQAVMNGPVAVDTFFTMSGALMSYNLLRELEKRKGTFNYPLMVLHRYLRITPTAGIMVGIFSTLMPYFASGPMAFILSGGKRQCRKVWWYNILYINNFLPDFGDMCQGSAWYLANDMQYFIFSPLIIYPMWRWRKFGFGILGIFSIASIVAPAVIQHELKLVPSNSPFIAQKSYAKDLYYSPWCRMGPYLVGIFLGYVLYFKSQKPSRFRKLPWFVVTTGWILSTVSALFIVFGIQSMLDPANAQWTFTSLDSALYSGFHRFAWGGSIAWIIFACVSGYGGFVNRFLSWSVFVPLGRLTFCIYVSSVRVQQWYHVTQMHPVHYSGYAMTNIYFAHMVMTSLMAYILTITIEAPFFQLEKLLLPQKKPALKTSPELPHSFNNNNNNKD